MLGMILAAGFSAFCAGEGPGAAAPPPRPNVLWLTCEDASPNLGCYGDAYAHTPHLDRFAAQGYRYTNAFGITGVCAVNRSALITGMYSTAIGSQGMRITTRLPEHIQCFTEYLRAAGYYCTNNVKTDYNFPVPPSAWDECSAKAHWRQRSPGQPFFAVFNYTGSHESQIWEENHARHAAKLKPGALHDPARVPLPPYHPDTPVVRQDWARYYDLVAVLDLWFAERLAELEAAGLADDTIVFFYSDHGAGMPGCKKWVWDSGLRVPLLIRIPERYRRLAGTGRAPGAVIDRIVSFVDFAPTVLSLCGVPIPAHMQGTAFLGPGAGAPRRYMFGIRDRMAERYDIVRVVRDARYQYLRNFWPHRSWSQYTQYTERMPTMREWRELAEAGKLRGPAARYFLPYKPVEELYDVARDPHQVQNLADDPMVAPVLERMRAALYLHMRETHDTGLLPEYELYRRAEGRTPYDVAVDPEANPTAALQAAADMANDMDAGRLPELVSMMRTAGDPAVRWWGAVGLAALGPGAAPARAALLEALGDPAPNVRVAAAEALAALGAVDAALTALTEALRHDASFIRLRAANALELLGPAARRALPVLEGARMPRELPGGGIDYPGEYLGRMGDYLPERLPLAAQ